MTQAFFAELLDKNSVRPATPARGSGKSETVYRELAERQKTAEGPRLLLVVPEQYSLQAERDMSRRLGRGFLHPWVLSFGRLAHRVFAECGTPRRLPLSDRSRAMVLRQRGPVAV